MEMYYKALCLLIVIILVRSVEGQLNENFYKSTCPNIETIVQQAVRTKVRQTQFAIPATLRLFFHDCFVEGCDASILIASRNNDAEKDAKENLSLAGDGFDTVTQAKKAVEDQCPEVVSCADILALAARDVVVLAGGPKFRVELGRRDGLISKASMVSGNLPGSNFNLDQLKTMFAKNNLSQIDMIALSGSHTLGFSHCSRFKKRLYSFSRGSQVDPTLNPVYAQDLMKSCPNNISEDNVVFMDPRTPQKFDNAYYQNLVEGKGLFTSDQVLYTDLSSRSTVKDFASNSGQFITEFATAMRRLGRVGVKTGEQGEIRKDCAAFNP